MSVNLVVAGLTPGTGPILRGFDVHVSYDRGVLSFRGVTFGSMLGDPGLVEALNLFDLSLLAPADLLALEPASFSLATLTFSTLGPGASALGISVNALADQFGASLPATLESGSVEVTARISVPEPGSLVLCGLGLAIAIARSRRPSRLSYGVRSADQASIVR